MALGSAAMMQQIAIAPGDHGACAAQQPHHGVPGGGGLPLVAGELSSPEDDLGDVLLGRACVRAVDRLQHAAGPRQLLPGQAGVGRNAAAMERGKEARHGLDAIEAIGSERDQCDEGRASRCLVGKNEMEALATAEFVQDVKSVIGAVELGDRPGRESLIAGLKDRGRRREKDGARILLRKPEHPGFGRALDWINIDIAVPIFRPHARFELLSGMWPR